MKSKLVYAAVILAAGGSSIPLQAGDGDRVLFYAGLHAGNYWTTQRALNEPGTSESHSYLGTDSSGGRLLVHSATASVQVLIDHELSKKGRPGWQKWAFRGVSVVASGGAMYLDDKARKQSLAVFKK